jgi:hypothetical protein
MTKIKSVFYQVFSVILVGIVFSSLSSVASNGYQSSNEVKTIKKGGFTLTFECKAQDFSSETSQKLIDTFFEVYPKLVKTYNKKSARKVAFVIDPDYDGVAATSNDRVVFSSKYMTSHPGDIDVVTHEVMHIVQAYGNNSRMPGWLTEGIADYVRYAYGVDNAGAGWKLPDFKKEHSYQNSYRITARFFAWMEKSGYKGIVKKMDEIGRKNTYGHGEVWKTMTGKTIDELWSEYANNPVI